MADMQRRTNDNRMTRQYVYGNAVPKRVNDPYRRPYREPEITTPRRESVIDERARRENERIARINRQKAQKLDLRYTAFLVLSVVFVFAACINFLRYTSTEASQSRDISRMERELAEFTAENIATKERITNAIDLDEVYRVASTELGMSYAREDQVIYYQGTNIDYVKQYKVISQ